MCNTLETIYHFVSNYDLKNERNIHFSKMKKQNILFVFDNNYSKNFSALLDFRGRRSIT